MDDEQLPKQMLYGELSYCNRDARGQKKRQRLHQDIRKFELLPGSLETLTTQRSSWRSVCGDVGAKCEAKHHERMGQGRQQLWN